METTHFHTHASRVDSGDVRLIATSTGSSPRRGLCGSSTETGSSCVVPDMNFLRTVCKNEGTAFAHDATLSHGQVLTGPR